MSIVRISKSVASMLGKTPEEVRPIVEAVFLDIHADLKDGQNVIIPGFGRFHVYPSGRIEFRTPVPRERRGLARP